MDPDPTTDTTPFFSAKKLFNFPDYFLMINPRPNIQKNNFILQA